MTEQQPEPTKPIDMSKVLADELEDPASPEAEALPQDPTG